MGILDLFKSKKRKEIEHFELCLDISTKILAIIKKKKEFSDRGIVDYNFETNMFDKVLVLNYYKNGVLDIFVEEYRNKIVRVFQSKELDENYKEDVNLSYHFLTSFTDSLRESIEKMKK